MRYCLRLMRSMVSVGDDGLNQDLVDQGAINQIIGRYCNFLSGGRRGDWGDKRNFIVFLGYILHYHGTSLLGDLWRTSIPFSKGRSLSHGLITSVHKTYCVIHRKERLIQLIALFILWTTGARRCSTFSLHISVGKCFILGIANYPWVAIYPWDSVIHSF